ncbi:MAG: response regulator transcription factor [Negativicutes bacterium]|nr:response regulator transcription factor [Negativicutes bacterium]
MRILLAEDDRRLGKLIKYMLEKEKLQVDWVLTGDAALEYALRSIHDVLILDWMMPGLSGVEVSARLRQSAFQGGIIILTAKDGVSDRVFGLDTGADDYLVKPFEFQELLARIRSVSRRSSFKIRDDLLEVGDLTLNRLTKTAKRATREIQLTGREFQLLELLSQNSGTVLPRELILDRIWGLEAEVSSNNLDAFVRLLRKKIDFPGEKALIHNIRGIGYKLGVQDV